MGQPRWLACSRSVGVACHVGLGFVLHGEGHGIHRLFLVARDLGLHRRAHLGELVDQLVELLRAEPGRADAQQTVSIHLDIHRSCLHPKRFSTRRVNPEGDHAAFQCDKSEMTPVQNRPTTVLTREGGIAALR